MTDAMRDKGIHARESMREWNPPILDTFIGLVLISGRTIRAIAINDLSLSVFRGTERVRRTLAALIGVINCKLERDESKTLT
jgi:hypothetical protein